ncbi:MAG: hypothetical protein [Olavius algarvensis Gamma 1 endosymbiont]|nr:MAG: hypothetical protein [Olavius algarvensis Gamma 1 endosymbiont]
MSPERRAKGGLGCPVSHPEHGDTLILLAAPCQHEKYLTIALVRINIVPKSCKRSA